MADTAAGSRIGLALLAAAEVPNFMAGLLPSLMTITKFNADPEACASLRRGELIGAALSVTVGVAASLLAHDPLPFVATVLVLATLVVAYEHAIRTPSVDAVSIADPSNLPS